MSSSYTPDRGDLIWLNFTPQSGHEQAGKRPALVLSPSKYNVRTGLLIACPVTSKVKGYPFEAVLQGRSIQGVVLSDQVKSLDWRAREAELIEKAPMATLTEVQEKLLLLLK